MECEKKYMDDGTSNNLLISLSMTFSLVRLSLMNALELLNHSMGSPVFYCGHVGNGGNKGGICS